MNNSPQSKVELYAAIRRDLWAGMSSRQVQRDRHVTWRTVKAASESAWPPQRAAYAERGSKLDPFKAVIEEMLVVDLDAPRKQRHTATRIFDRLVGEHQLVDVSYDTVRAYIAKRRPEVRVEHGRGASEVFVPQTHLPGREAEVDFGEITVRLRGALVTCHLFALRMSYSGKAVHRSSATGGQEAFFEGHEHAFQTLGGVPAGKIRYDNLKAAVGRSSGFLGSGSRPIAGSRSGPTSTSTPSTASPGSRVPTRRAGWRATSAGSAATTSCPFPRSARSPSSTS